MSGMLATAMARDADPDILGMLAESPQVKRMLRDRAVVVLAERAAQLRDLRALETEAAAAAPKLAAAIEKVTAEKKKVDAAQRSVDERLSTAIIEKHNFSVEFGRRHDALEAALRATASPLIGKFCEEMRAAWDKTRRSPLIETTAESEKKNPLTGRYDQYIRTNSKLVATRLRAIREVIAAAEDLAITEADQSEATIGARLGELAAKLPPMI